MKHRERILCAFAHKEADRVPVDFAGTDCSSLHVQTCQQLKSHLKIDLGQPRLGCLIQQVVEPDLDLLDCFDGDALALFFYPRQWRTWDSPYGCHVWVPDRWRPESLENGDLVLRDAQGVIRSIKPAQSCYFDPINPILANIDDPMALDRYQAVFERWDWPAVLDESVEDYGRRAQEVYRATDRAVVASWRMHLLQSGQILRGYEQFLLDLYLNESLVKSIFERLTQTYIERAERFLKAMNQAVDVIFLTDDLGTQQGPLIPVDLYRRLVKPYFARLVQFIKKKSGKPILLHSCGAIRDFIPDLIEIGIDALNPVQISARGMEPVSLKKEFGKDIVFWGGGCDTQAILNRATPREIRDHVWRNLDAMVPGGGYVFTQVHNIQVGIPPENINALYQAALEYGRD